MNPHRLTHVERDDGSHAVIVTRIWEPEFSFTARGVYFRILSASSGISQSDLYQNPQDFEEVAEAVEGLLRDGIITRTTSPSGEPILAAMNAGVKR
jgi:hypothetical protein